MIDWHTARAHCLAKPGTSEDKPFGPDVLVMRVADKMFALFDAQPPADDTPTTINLKCDPELAVILRETYAAVQPGYHMNKRHWNTITLDGSIPDDEVLEMIDESYRLVARGLKKAQRQALGLD